MTKVAIYCRVDHGESKYSPVAIDCQRKQLERYAEKHDLFITGSYSDCGYPGTTLDRPGLQELLNAWRAGEFDAVLVCKRTCLYRESSKHHHRLTIPVISLEKGTTNR